MVCVHGRFIIVRGGTHKPYTSLHRRTLSTDVYEINRRDWIVALTHVARSHGRGGGGGRVAEFRLLPHLSLQIVGRHPPKLRTIVQIREFWAGQLAPAAGSILEGAQAFLVLQKLVLCLVAGARVILGRGQATAEGEGRGGGWSEAAAGAAVCGSPGVVVPLKSESRKLKMSRLETVFHKRDCFTQNGKKAVVCACKIYMSHEESNASVRFQVAPFLNDTF